VTSDKTEIHVFERVLETLDVADARASFAKRVHEIGVARVRVV
jgi:hypothetical protein